MSTRQEKISIVDELELTDYTKSVVLNSLRKGDEWVLVPSGLISVFDVITLFKAGMNLEAQRNIGEVKIELVPGETRIGRR